MANQGHDQLGSICGIMDEHTRVCVSLCVCVCLSLSLSLSLTLSLILSLALSLSRDFPPSSQLSLLIGAKRKQNIFLKTKLNKSSFIFFWGRPSSM
mmetsp:Transcript_7196/g.10047  ORF Transcript_7196/g.10047 Transcript_7196/m.10047 type:complete len:96 (+) Transcript_7196:148-435(+)